MVVLVHGVAEHSGRYNDLAKSFASRGIAVEAMDHRGHGRSEGRRVWVDRFDQYLDDFDKFMRGVQRRHPSKPLFIIGHSLGGTIATLYALERKPNLRGIILSAPALRPGTHIPEWMLPLGRFLGRYLPGLPVRKFKASKRSKSVRPQEVDELTYRGWMPARTAAEIIKAIKRIRIHPEKFRYALLLLHGMGDRMTHPEGSRAFHKRAASADKTLLLYEGLYHGLLAKTDNDPVFSDIVNWVESRC